ncbi:MAG: transglycosylase domain-containing protein, partial [Candidatus Humimicrobiaceae bacterium]
MSKLREKHKRNKVGLKVLIVLVALFLLTTILFLAAFGGISIAVTGIISDFMSDLPEIEDFKPTESALTSRIYANDGTLIANFHGEQNRELVSLEQIPQKLINAAIAIEDERFYQHNGVDFEGIIRAFIINLQTGEIVQGASTITQQVIRNLYIPEEKYEITYDRKIKEAVLAYQLERIYTKEEVLEMYLNTVYFGEGTYGVQTASKVYFNKDVEYLNLAEAALLAGLLRDPNKTPYIDKDFALERRNIVLAKMLELNYISAEDYEKALSKPVIVQRPQEEEEEGFAPYFVEYVKQKLIEKYGVNRVFKGGFKIYTTLDPPMQVAAEKAIEEILYDPEDPAAALVAIDPETGYIKAMQGGKDFGDMKFNLATQAKRQPGSTFKVFALLAALEQGISPQVTFNPNGPVIFEIEGSEPWEVSNYMGTDYEQNEMSILEGTVKSVNVVYSQLIMKVGAYSLIDIAKRMGITTELRPYPAVGLGGLTEGVSPLETCSAFATVANYGVKNDPVAILKVVDNDGEVLEEY